MSETEVHRRAFFVLGMHRSGTSALARLLNLVGVDLGANLLPPAADNETGFWEHREIQAIHDRILRSMRRGWASVSPMPPDWQHQPQMAGFRDELTAAATRDFHASTTWGLKDPRLCFTLPLWRDALVNLASPHCVLIVRNPAEVVRSLERRNGITASRGYLLWLRSLLDAERDSRGLPRSITRYNALLQDWRGQLTRIGNDLGIDWPIPLDDAAAAVEDFLKPTLRHHQVEDATFLNDAGVPEPVRQAFTAAVIAADTGDFAPLSGALDELRPQLEDVGSIWTRFIADVEADYFTLGVAKHEQGLEMAEHVHEAHRQLAAAKAALAEQTHRAEATELELHAVTKHAAGLSDVVENLRERLSMSEQHAAELQTHAAGLDQRNQDLAAQLDQATQAATQHAAFLDGTIDNLRTRLAMSEQHASQLSARRDELEAIRQQHEVFVNFMQQTWRSRAWRWTGALRSLARRPLSREQLVAQSPLQPMGAFTWRAAERASFLLPCLPVRGSVTARLQVRSTTTCHAVLYIDTGQSFNEQQKLDLGAVGGETHVGVIESRGLVAEPAFFFRLDLNFSGEADFCIEVFEIQFT